MLEEFLSSLYVHLFMTCTIFHAVLDGCVRIHPQGDYSLPDGTHAGLHEKISSLRQANMACPLKESYELLLSGNNTAGL